MRKLLSAMVAVVFLSGACTPSEEPSPTPTNEVTPSPFPTPGHGRTSTPTPTSEPTPEPTFTQELNDDQQEAYDTAVEYFTLHDELMKDPHGDWQSLIDLTTGESRNHVLREFETMRANGEKRVGDQLFYILHIGDVTEFEGEPAIFVRACTDSAESDVINVETGESVMEVEKPLILDRELTLVRESGSLWVLTMQQNELAESCQS